MDLKGRTGICRLLQALRTTSNDNLLNRTFGAFGDFTTGSTTCTEGSSAAIVSAKGAVAASLFGSSLSLQNKQKARGFT
jgi:hypothetical protein